MRMTDTVKHPHVMCYWLKNTHDPDTNNTEQSGIQRWLNLSCNLFLTNLESNILCTFLRVKKLSCLQDWTLISLTLDPVSLSSHHISLPPSAPMSFMFCIMDLRPGSFCEHNIEGDYCPVQAGGQCRNPRATDSTDSHMCRQPDCTQASTHSQSADCSPPSLKPCSPLFENPCLEPPFLHGVTSSFQWAS